MKVKANTVWWAFTCRVCGAECEAEPTDVTDRPNIDIDGDTVGYICVVECGRCGKEHDVPHDKVTAKIEGIAANKRRR